MKKKKINETSAEQLCEGVREDIRQQAITLANAVFAMQEKIEQQIPKYQEMDLAQEVTVGTGETMLRQNPAVQEFRATVKDYAAALNNLQDILAESKASTKVSDMSELRKQFKMVR